MTLINVRVIALQRHTLSALAAAWKGECWTSERSPNGWRWEFAFPSQALAQQFLAALPTSCQGVLAVLPSLQDRQEQEEPAERPEQRQLPKLFEFFDWSDRAEAVGFRLYKYGTRGCALRREADGELMADDLDWEQMATLIEQLEGKGNQL
ncbi:hypothetical protein H6F76_18400 [Leptolyngbya sp. FACHB-321]|uniref:hypothetical protein n=1 Tax=Leptolyngbya sp. FACHB-321 TaxID=2692807 RepID=UPI001681C832|nr:hypothetical protein [Leptolyngbya sp. FACHB-321]MBD2036980.1 hypothetical protein [Leptolyngbya sp. FACHB-321]